jgi:LuxR family maltose regulon positive regulatory protein
MASLKQTVGNLLESKEGLQVYKLHAAAQHLFIHGKINEATQKFVDAYLMAQSDNQHYIALLSAKDAAMNLLVLGKKKECDRFCRQVLGHYSTEGRGVPSLAAMMYLPMAASSYVGNDLEGALSYIEEGLLIYRKLSMVYLVLQAEFQLSVIQQGLGHTDQALKTISDAIGSLVELDFHQAMGFMKAVEADFLLAAGRKEQAVRWADGASVEVQGAISLVNERQAVIYSRILMADNRADDAWEMLARLENSMTEGHRNYRLVTVYLLQSMLHYRQNHTKQAFALMEKALRLAENEELFRLFLDEGPDVFKIIQGIPTARTKFIGKLFTMAQEKNEYIEHIKQGSDIQDSAKPTALLDCLSEREIEVLQLAAEGCSNQDIARTLYITLGTVKWHMNNIFSKTGTNRRTQAIAYARELNII